MTASVTARVAQIHRFPVKSIGGESLDHVELIAGQAMPGDRHYAVLHKAALHHLEDGTLQKWLPKSAFVRGVAAPLLQAVKGGWDGDVLVLTHPDLPNLQFDPDGGGEVLVEWLSPLWAESGKAEAAQLVTGPLPLTDVKKPWVSILSLSSLAELEKRLGRPLGVDRWRGNIWVDGWPAWYERDLRLAELSIGGVRMKVRENIGRCAATSADTDTGRLDGDMPADLRAVLGDANFGIYAEPLDTGRVGVNDKVVVL